MTRWRIAALVLVASAGCSDEAGEESCAAGEQRVDGRCVPMSTCPAPAIDLVDGSCTTVGTPADRCGEGFEPIEGACYPILPPEPCAPGTKAVPGETSCRPVAACPAERWGGIDPGPNPQFVDGTYTGGDGDGSEERPWTTVVDAVTAAAPGAVIAIARGSYLGNVEIQGKAVHLRGVCPAEVEIAGVATTNGTPAIVLVGAAAGGSSIASLSVTGPSVGVAMSGALDVVLDRVWIHDTGDTALDIEDPLGTASAAVTDSLVEGATGYGVQMVGSSLTMDRSTVRGTVVRGEWARGIAVQASSYTGARSALTLRRSVLADNGGIALFVTGSDAIVDQSVLHGTVPAGNAEGEGISAQVALDTGERADLQLTQSAVLSNQLVGVQLFGSTARLEATLVANTQPGFPGGGSDLDGGRGINVQDDFTGDRGAVEIVQSTVEDSHGIGIFAAGSDLLLDQALVRRSVPGGDESGRGISLRPSGIGEASSTASVQRTLVADSGEFGIMVGGSTMTLEDSVVRQVAPSAAGQFGDVVAVLASPAELHASRTSFEQGGRAGLSVFGAVASLTDCLFSCHSIDIAVQDLLEVAAHLDDGGGNRCGCDGERYDCAAVSADLEPPSPTDEL